MINDIKMFFRKRQFLFRIVLFCYLPLKRLKELPVNIAASKAAIMMARSMKNGANFKIIHFGVPAHPNLGDQAQWYYIRKWLNKYYPEIPIYEFSDKMIRDDRYGLVKLLQQKVKPEDLIIFQSGYCTSDQNMPAEIMHRTIVGNFPENRIVVFPQTINYFSKKQKQISSDCYNRHGKILFLVRDKFSFSLAEKIFPVPVKKLFPDIVTSRIGKHQYNFKRNKVLFCMRSDGEQYYSKKAISQLRERLRPMVDSDLTDTTLKISGIEMQKNIKRILETTFDQYAHYKVLVTDRYHGTIFSLIAGTPVVVLSSTDHKLSSGVDWFKRRYPGHIYFAKNMAQAYNNIKTIIQDPGLYHEYLDDYYDRKYYQKLYNLINDTLG